MEKNKSFNFHDKNSLIPIFDEFHDHRCTFKILDDHELEILIDSKGKKQKISVTFVDTVLDSFTIYSFRNDNGKFIGEVIDNNQTEDLESLYIELIDCLFTDSDLILLSADLIDGKYGNRVLIKLVNILNIAIQ